MRWGVRKDREPSLRQLRKQQKRIDKYKQRASSQTKKQREKVRVYTDKQRAKDEQELGKEGADRIAEAIEYGNYTHHYARSMEVGRRQAQKSLAILGGLAVVGAGLVVSGKLVERAALNNYHGKSPILGKDWTQRVLDKNGKEIFRSYKKGGGVIGVESIPKAKKFLNP